MWRRSAHDRRAGLITLSQLFGIAALVVGFVILGGVIVRLVQLRGEIPADFVPWFRDIFGDDPARAYHLVLNLIFSIVGLAVGIRLAILGLANVRPIQASTAGPRGFRTNDEVVHAIRDREIPSFRPAYSLGSYLFQGLSAGRLAFLPQGARSVFLENAAFVRTAILLLPIVIVVFYFDDYIFSAVDPPPDLPSPAGLLAVISVIVGLKFASCALLTPFKAPTLQAASETQTVTNAGDAATAHSRLKEAVQELVPPGGSARCWEESLALSGGGIADRGTVKGTLLVETEAEPADAPNPYAALLLLVAGLFLLPVGILALTHLDVARDPFNSRDTFVRLTLPGALTKTAVFLLCALYGSQFFGQAKTLLARVRFRSVAYLLEMSGAYGRAAVRIGKATDDSIESESVAVSSDLSLSYYGAELLAESAEADSPRYVVAVAAPRGVEQAFKVFEAEINEFAARGVQVQRPELASPEVLHLLRANLDLAAQKRQPLESIGRGAAPHPAPELPASEEPAKAVTSGEAEQCPSCGEEVGAGAKFCGSCGHELARGNSSESAPAGDAGESAGEAETER